ncbi:MAG TPA: HAMP domain-containing sensor histidine kinase [Dongiaceae bacterium]|jgi:signal transduction histidine kinase
MMLLKRWREWLRDLSIRDKILVGYFLLGLPVIATLALTSYGAHQLMTQMDSLRTESVPVLSSLENIRSSSLKLTEAIGSFALLNAVAREAGDPPNPFSEDKRSEIFVDLLEFDSAMARFVLTGNIRTRAEDRMVQDLRIQKDDLSREAYRVLRLVDRRASPEDILDWRQNFDAMAGNFQTLIDGALRVEKTALDQRQEQISEQIRRQVLIATMIALGCGALAFFGGYRISNAVATPIRRLKKAAVSIAEGQFDLPALPSGGDEVGQLAKRFSEMARKLQGLMLDLRGRADAAEGANRAKSSFLAHVSHELRTPLNAIIGFSEILRAETQGPLGSDRYRDYVGDIHDSGNHLLKLVNDLLDMAKAEAGRLEIRDDVVDIQEVVQACAALLDPICKAASVTLQLSVATEGRCLRGDEVRLRQILLNLLNNAVKFTPAGGDVRLTIGWNEDNAMVVAISDTGIGIGPDDLSKVLQPFGQAGDIMTRRHQGTGLGLPLTKALVDLHGGRLQIDSELGQGTIVHIEFPPERTVMAAPGTASAEGKRAANG